MENTTPKQDSRGYVVNLTEKQFEWLTNTAQNLEAMASLKQRGLITSINEKLVLDNITALNKMIIKHTEKK